LAEERVYEALRRMLDGAGVAYREAEHEAARTSEESAAARGEPLNVGGKALVLRVGGEFRLFVLSAARRLDSKKVQAHFTDRRIRFATPQELLLLTGLVPGAVPPFGHPVLPFELYVDESILRNDRVAFNAGLLTRSMVLSREDYLRLARPVEVFDFSEAGARGP
jgi:Ala-tRNA(Pro) deacylase